MKVTLEYLAWQKKQEEDKIKIANEINEKEKVKLREQWKKDEEYEKQEKLEKLISNKQANAEVERFNE